MTTTDTSAAKKAVTPRLMKNFVGGAWVNATAPATLDVENPASGEILAKVPLSNAADVDAAVQAARAAYPGWRATPPLNRARYMFTLKNLMEEHFETLAGILTREHGKTLSESRGSVRRAIENVEVATGIPSLMQGSVLEDVAQGIDCEAVRQPLGVFACIAPFNFPAMVPLWFLPYAIAAGNTFIVKPSEQVPLCQEFIFQMLENCGFPPGVVNLVNGGKDAVNGILDHPGIAGVSFVGSSPVARHVYKRAGETGKRVQALGGAKNFMVVLGDANLDRTADAITESFCGCAGERCLAGSVVLAEKSIHRDLVERIRKNAASLVVGDGSDPRVQLGPVISAAHREKVLGYIEKGVAEGAKMLLDGRKTTVAERPGGHWLGPTLFDEATPDMVISREEIFGPVLTVIPVDSLDQAIGIIHASEFGNATSIFTDSGRAAREFRYRAEVSMMGINIGVAAPMSFFSFGGTKGSFFGDLKAHGRDAIEFYTDKKMVISRWF